MKESFSEGAPEPNIACKVLSQDIMSVKEELPLIQLGMPYVYTELSMYRQSIFASVSGLFVSFVA